ncbi:hypothetical protein HPG69_002029 [Diceros bicornis minor]|uniref:Uncharacterized protein n=1 Tax=Diceros bicornis minor TaxID=77932 RepID=A0A7J7FBY4_DICBM|nr:hypothetical protein HPG69_002029 [Diceros bicornis minor]
MLAAGSCWRPASPPGLTGAPGSEPSKLGASGRGAPEPRRPLHQCVPQPRSLQRERTAWSVAIPRRSCSSQRSLPNPARRGADAGEAELARGKAQARGGGEMKGREPGGFPPALPPPTGAENVICCAFQARFPGVTSPSRPGRGEQTKRRGKRRGGPRGEAGGVRGAGAVPGKGADSRSGGGGGGSWPMERRGPGRRARPPAFKPETARCPALGAPSADRATQSAARASLPVRLTPRRAPAARAAAAHRATRRERRPRRPAALTGERPGAGQGVCVGDGGEAQGSAKGSRVPLGADARQLSVGAGPGPAVPWGEP